MKVTLLALLLSLIARATAAASVPSLLNYQAVLRDGAGDIVPDGNYSVTFRIWDSESGGTALWQEGRLVTVQGGLFTVLLGSVVSIPDTLFNQSDRWIGLQVGLDPEMSPRQRLVTVPFAWHAKAADLADTAAHSLDRTTDASELISGTLDTSRYSAYQDLAGEGRIGLGVDDIAPGDHRHPEGTIRILEDTSLVEVTLVGAGTATLKLIHLPSSGLGHYGRMVFHTHWDFLDGASNTTWRITIDDSEVYAFNDLSAGYDVQRLEFFRISDGTGTTWFFRSESAQYTTTRTIDLSDGGDLVFSVSQSAAGTHRFGALEFYIEFEGH